ncbi:cation diffusion facilitator family transporter [Paenibacillus glycinis]|uniref:Cation diffusion facilitator family transporter n=1 Tax=Paenibacillus glycinis TaxID=2697035 RepID=A0ABW9XNS6_9BACL|nr:cation diffusion facilitator family transporter [Paenibacillus glycinis]NBD24275.1 cation diffusion facilitator family transporter [Paenibacillus glycinis]
MSHNHSHGHDHGHGHGDVFHSHAPIGKMKQAFFLSFVILAVELVGGFISHSLALLSDAGHVLTDIAAIGLSWYAMRQSLKAPSEGYTFGYHRSGILAAFINAVSLILIAFVILWEAVQRFQSPQEVGSTWMFIGAGVGLIMNLYLGLGLSKEDNVNVKSAVLHMLGDAAASAGVIVGGIIIHFTGWYVIDPILSVLIALLIAVGAVGLVRETIRILMEATPKDVDIRKVADTIRSVDGVHAVHDLHVWSITSGKNALSCHVTLDGQTTIERSQTILRDIEHRLLHLGIGHCTVQMEDDKHPHADTMLCCDAEPAHAHGHSGHEHEQHAHGGGQQGHEHQDREQGRGH